MDNYKEILQRVLFIHANKLINDLSAMTKCNISLSMLKYLDAIYMNSEITPSELAVLVGVSRPAATKMVKRLAEYDYVTKTHTQNHNSYTLSLTEKASEIYIASNKADDTLVELLDKYLNIKDIENIDDRLANLLSEYELIK